MLAWLSDYRMLDIIINHHNFSSFCMLLPTCCIQNKYSTQRNNRVNLHVTTTSPLESWYRLYSSSRYSVVRTTSGIEYKHQTSCVVWMLQGIWSTSTDLVIFWWPFIASTSMQSQNKVSNKQDENRSTPHFIKLATCSSLHVAYVFLCKTSCQQSNSWAHLICPSLGSAQNGLA